MKKSYHFVKVAGFAECRLSSDNIIRLPVVQGIFKHATVEMLHDLLQRPAAAKKYTIESLRTAPWPILREFPYSWLKMHIEEADLRPMRKKAILFMISDESINSTDIFE